MNIEKARFNMIEQQIRPWRVLDKQVLDLMSTIPREQFVSEAYQGLAFADIAIPLGNNRFMLHPREEGRLLQAVKPSALDKVLVISSGSGYVTALLASLAKEVIAVDSSEDFVMSTRETLAALNINNVSINCTDAIQGCAEKGPYEVIVILGSMQILPEALKKQMTVGGKMFCIIGKEPTMEALLVHRSSQTKWEEEGLFETLVPSLENAPEAEQFHF